MGQLFFAPFDQSQRTAVVFAARVGYLRAGSRVVSHEALKPFTQILAIGRVLPTRLSAIRSATAQRRPMHARMVDSLLRWEGREIGYWETGELVYRLAYNGDVAAGQLAVFQGGTSRTAVAKRPYLNACF